jgi:hypothetical protein
MSRGDGERAEQAVRPKTLKRNDAQERILGCEHPQSKPVDVWKVGGWKPCAFDQTQECRHVTRPTASNRPRLRRAHPVQQLVRSSAWTSLVGVQHVLLTGTTEVPWLKTGVSSPYTGMLPRV